MRLTSLICSKIPRYPSMTLTPSSSHPSFSPSQVQSAFPGAVKNEQLVDKVASSLAAFGYGSSTLLCTSLCCDEVNRELDEDLSSRYGSNFSLGGLAGFPFGGVTGFGAMAAHIPEGGSCLVVYGPHVGIDADGVVGKVNRRAQKQSSSCCGSAAAAAAYVSSVYCGEFSPTDAPKDCIDAQQTFVGSLLLPHAERLANASDPAVELPFALYDAQKELISKIVAAGCSAVPGKGKIALLGGIQINTPDESEDYFLPLSFEVIDNQGDLVVDMMKLVDFSGVVVNPADDETLEGSSTSISTDSPEEVVVCQ